MTPHPRDPLAQIAFLDSLEAKGMAESHVHYGIVEKTMRNTDPAEILAQSIATDLGSDTTLFEARLEPDQKNLLDRSLQYFLARNRRQDLLDHGLFQAASLVRAPEVFHALIDLGANPLRDMQSNALRPRHHQGAIVEALLHGSPGAAIAMMEKSTQAQAVKFAQQWLEVKDTSCFEEMHPHLAQSLRQTTTPARGLLPKGLPDFLSLLEQKIGTGKKMDSIREDVVLQYLRSCYHVGHAWTPEVLASLAGNALAAEGSCLARHAKKDAAEKLIAGKEHRRASWYETLGQFALLTHCAPVLEVLKPMIAVHAKLPLDQHTEIRIVTALEQKTVSDAFPFNAVQFQAALNVMVGQGHAFVIDFEHDGKASRYSVLHDLAGHNGKNTYPHRMEKLLGLLEAGADPSVRNLAGQVPATMVKPPADRHQWQGVVNARRARLVAYDVLKELERSAP